MKTLIRSTWLGLFAALSSAACAESGDPGQESEVQAAWNELHLGAWFGDPATLWGEASYKAKREPPEKGALVRTLEVDVVHAKPGVSHVLQVDGVQLGKMLTDLDGEAEFELQTFPEGFSEPKAGSVIQIGDLMELRLDKLEKLIDLQAIVDESGGLSGRIGFKKERVGKALSKEFRVKVAGAPVGSTHAVTLEDVKVGDLVIDDEGEGKLEISTKLAAGFPESIPEPKAGATVRVGELFSGRLEEKRGS